MFRLCTFVSTMLLIILVWAVITHIRAKRKVVSMLRQFLQMNCDELINQLLLEESGNRQDPAPNVQEANGERPSVSGDHHERVAVISNHRERLAALAAGGQASQYLGKKFTAEQIDVLSDDEVEKLYGRYEARLGAAATKTLGLAALQLYTLIASTFLPIPTENHKKLIEDLKDDPFVGHALSSATCKLYHRYRMFLAPLAVALTTAKHCQFWTYMP